MYFNKQKEHLKYNSIQLVQYNFELENCTQLNIYNSNTLTLYTFRWLLVLRSDCFKFVLLFLRFEFVSFLPGNFSWIRKKNEKIQSKLFLGTIKFTYFGDLYFDYLLKIALINRLMYFEKVEDSHDCFSILHLPPELFNFMMDTLISLHSSSIHYFYNKRFQEFCFCL